MNKKMTVTLRRQGMHYVIEKLTNTTSVNAIDGHTKRDYRVGDWVSESAAESLASNGTLDVTVRAERG
jgi:ribosomal protein S17